MTDIHELTALELAATVRRGDVSPAEVVEHSLGRAERLGPLFGAFVTVTPDLARQQAKAAQAALAGPEPLPPLLGVPCPVKDLAMVAEIPCSMGSWAFRDMIAPVDDGVVTLLREAGTVMLGKTTTPEFGLPCYTEPDVAPPARTPWDPTRSAGGSSGGSAAAVAAGIVPVAHASDGGGSIRIPASACGLVGLKPNRGRISPGPHGVDGAGFASPGVLTRDVRDTAALLDVLTKSWLGDQHLLPRPRTTFLDACDRDPGSLRVGVLTEPVIVEGVPVHEACLTAVEETAALLEELGHHVTAAPVPFPAERWAAFDVIWSVMALLTPVPGDAEHLLRPLTRWLRSKARSVTGYDYASAISGIQRATRDTAVVWDRYDVICTPTLARPPALVGELRDDEDPAGDFRAQTEFTPWTSVWNLTGWPSVSLPLHRAQVDGVTVPIGVMFGGRQGAEETLLGLAAQLEQARPWRDARPPVWSGHLE